MTPRAYPNDALGLSALVFVLEKGAALDAMDSYGRAVDAAPAFANAHQDRSRMPEILSRRNKALVALVGRIFIDASRQDNRLVPILSG